MTICIRVCLALIKTKAVKAGNSDVYIVLILPHSISMETERGTKDGYKEGPFSHLPCGQQINSFYQKQLKGFYYYFLLLLFPINFALLLL